MAEQQEEKVKYMNPRLVMRMWMAHLPTDLPGNLRSIFIALWIYSDCFFLEEELIDGDSTFTSSRTGLRQLAEFTGYGRTVIQRKLVELREKWGLVDYELDNHPHGTAYTVYTTPQVFAPRMIESKRKVERFLKEIKKTYKYNEKKPSRWDEPDEPEADESTMESPWPKEQEPNSISPWDNENVDSGTRVPELIDWTQVLFTFDSGTFDDLTQVQLPGTQVLSGLTQVHGGPSVFDLSFDLASKRSGEDVLATPSSDRTTKESKAKHNQHQPPHTQGTPSPDTPDKGYAPVPRSTQAAKPPHIEVAAVSYVHHVWKEDGIYQTCAVCGMDDQEPGANLLCPGKTKTIAASSTVLHGRKL